MIELCWLKYIHGESEISIRVAYYHVITRKYQYNTSLNISRCSQSNDEAHFWADKISCFRKIFFFCGKETRNIIVNSLICRNIAYQDPGLMRRPNEIMSARLSRMYIHDVCNTLQSDTYRPDWYAARSTETSSIRSKYLAPSICTLHRSLSAEFVDLEEFSHYGYLVIRRRRTERAGRDFSSFAIRNASPSRYVRR